MKKLVSLVLALTVIFPLASCAPAPKETPTLRLGVMYSTDIVPLAVLKDQKLDEKSGFILDMQVFQSAKDRDAALQAGELDGVFTDYIGVCIYQNAGLDVKITGVTDGDYLFVTGADSGIATLADARGASIAISENTLIEYSLDYILAQNGESPDYVKKEVVPKIPDRLEMLRTGNIDLGLLPDPFATLALGSGATKLGSANDAGLYPAVMGFLSSAISEKSDTLKMFYAAYREAVDYVNSTPIADFEAVAIAGAGFPEELKGQITLPSFRKDTLPTGEDLQSAIDWAAAKGLCADTLKPDDLLADLG
ncbi:MAG: metal ABC transporter substrate-binding protein [Clostridia bacterium]|nr:metal ABC transporter substrate-binding protein [Clostridia bacterium]